MRTFLPLIFLLSFLSSPSFAQDESTGEAEPEVEESPTPDPAEKKANPLPSIDDLINKNQEEPEDPESKDDQALESNEAQEPGSAPVVEVEGKGTKLTKEQSEILIEIGRMISEARRETKSFSERKNIEKQRLEIEFIEKMASSKLDFKPKFDNQDWKNAMAAFHQNKCSSAKKFALASIKDRPDLKKDPEFKLAFASFQACAGQRGLAQQSFKKLALRTDAVGIAAGVMIGKTLAIDPIKSLTVKQQLDALLLSADKNPLLENLRVLKELESSVKGRTNARLVRLTRAKLLAKSGQTKAAKRAFLDLLRDTFGSLFNSQVSAAIRAFEKTHNINVLSYADNIDLMRSYIRRGKYRDAKQVSINNAKRLKLSSKEIRGWMFYRQGLEAEKRKKRAKAVELFAKANKIVSNHELRPRLYFGWARALRRTNRDKKAISLYGKICKEYPQHHLCDNALYEAGRLQQYASKHKKAVEKFTKILAFKHSEYKADALWRRGFSYYLSGDFEKSKIDFERLEKEFGHKKDASELTLGLKASYWIGVSLHKSGKKDLALSQYKKTLGRGPLTWYGRLAAARLEELGFGTANLAKPRKIEPKEMENFSTLSIPASASLEPVALWIRLGFYKRAQSWVAGLSRSPKAEKGTTPLLSALNLYFDRPDLAHWNMKRFISEKGPTEDSARNWAVAFPNPYRKESRLYGERAGVSPHLVQAIIRQESGFRPNVKSWAGAVGLMQLMPGTARYVAQVFDKKESYSRSQLTKVDTNVRLGSMYIRLHTAFANDRIPLALAGYNAGPAPLESWMKRYGNRELDAFVESITYREARGYVRKVFTSYVTYSGLYGDTLPVLNLKLPAKLRKWGDLPRPKVSFFDFNLSLKERKKRG